MARTNPFIPPGKDHGAVDTESRLRALEEFNLEQCHAALEVLGLQATVEKKLRIRIRALEKLATSDGCPSMAQPSTASELDYTHMSRRMLEELAKLGKCVVATADMERLVRERDAAQDAHRITLEELHAMEVHVAEAGRQIDAAQVGRVPEPCKHVFTDDGMFTVHCSKCDLEIKAEPSDEVMDHARQLAFEAGGVDDGSYLLTGDDFDQIVSEACAMAVIEYAATPQPAKGE